jgi:DNA-binding beta-propeller fold protein YncE
MVRRVATVLGAALVIACLGASLAAAGADVLSRLEEDRDVEAGGSAQGLDLAHSVAASPDNENVYATGLDDDAVVTFEREGSGALTRVEEDRDPSSGGSAEGLDGAEGVDVSPDGKHVYVTSVNDSAVVTFKRKGSGKLKRVEMDQDPSEGGNAEGLHRANTVTVSPDGKHVYVTASMDDSVVTFKRNKKKGKLKRVEEDRDPSSGGSAEGLDGAVDSAVSPDGENVYVAGADDSAIVTFDRDPVTGLLTRVEEDRDVGAGGSAEGLGGAISAAVSFDGEYVYGAGSADSALVVLSRDGDGLLTLVEEHRDVAAGGTDEGLDNPRRIAVSPDDGWVYTTARDDDALVTFERTTP